MLEQTKKSDEAIPVQNTVERDSQIDRLLHVLAGLVLLTFAASHFAFLIVPNISTGLHLQNIVFPIFNDNTVYFMGGLFETAIGLLCLKFRGAALTNLLIIMFIGIILWYRSVFFYNGGIHCHCLGYLGRLLHVGKTTENILPVFALVLLFFTTLPWLYRKASHHFRRVMQGFFILLFFTPQLSLAIESIEIQGDYDAANYNPASEAHERYQGTEIHATFVVKISDHIWFISVSNVDTGDLSQLWFDGTNTFTLNKIQLGVSNDKQYVATVSPSKYYIPGNKDYMDISFPWLVYGLSPGIVSSNNLGLVDIPLPWLTPRYHPDAFGYKWIFSPSSDGRFVADCKIVRDQALDLANNEEEMLRPDLVYPDSVMRRNSYIIGINTWKYIPSGFVAADYKCEQWQQTNGWSLPIAATARYYWPDFKLYTNTWFEGHLKANKIVVYDHAVNLPQPANTIQVVDFRYRKFNGTRLYWSALYTLKAGDSWKSANDPVLLSEAKHYLSHGPRFDDFSPGGGKRIIIWLVFVALLLMPSTAILYSKHKQKNKIK